MQLDHLAAAGYHRDLIADGRSPLQVSKRLKIQAEAAALSYDPKKRRVHFETALASFASTGDAGPLYSE